MRSPFSSFDKQISWEDLDQIALRERAVQTNTLNGVASLSYVNCPRQEIRAYIYPYLRKNAQGGNDILPEGLIQETTNLMLCNYTATERPNSPKTDIQVADRITDQNGVQYRCLGVLNDGGTNHHMLCALKYISTGT